MWFEVAVIATVFGVGHIVSRHFEEGTPRWRRLAELVIHAWWLPRKGINGWTGEAKEGEYALRGWKWPSA